MTGGRRARPTSSPTTLIGGLSDVAKPESRSARPPNSEPGGRTVHAKAPGNRRERAHLVLPRSDREDCPGEGGGEHASERTTGCVSEHAQPTTHAWTVR